MHRPDHGGNRAPGRAPGRCDRRRLHGRRSRAGAARDGDRLTFGRPAQPVSPVQFAAGAVFAGAIAAVAFRARALSRGGGIAAFCVGTLTFGFGGWPLTLVLLAFFIPSIALSRFGRARKRRLTDIGKGGPRDAAQVLANGGIATLCAIGTGLSPASATAFGAWYAAFAGAYAAATADTWGTEIGTLLRRPPRSILTLRPIPTGLSGGITWPGTLAEIAGAVWIGLAAALSSRLVPHVAQSTLRGTVRIALAVAVAGVAGALVDSFAGATLQELRRCPACERSCETNPHSCGTPTLLVRGVRGFGNDAVNAAATLAGAAIALVLTIM